MRLEFENVTIALANSVRPLDNLSLCIGPGEQVAILGPSGSGKSTLLNMAAGLCRPTGGRFSIAGVDGTTTAGKELRRRIAMVHQQFSLVPRASVRANVIMGSAARLPAWRIMLGAYPDAVSTEAMSAIAAVGLDSRRARHRVSALSGGQQQRVAIARAMMGSPAVILADEPVSSLDPMLAKDMMILLTSLASRLGASLVCSLHQHDLARRYYPRIVSLEAGRVTSDERRHAPPPKMRRISCVTCAKCRKRPDAG